MHDVVDEAVVSHPKSSKYSVIGYDSSIAVVHCQKFIINII